MLHNIDPPLIKKIKIKEDKDTNDFSFNASKMFFLNLSLLCDFSFIKMKNKDLKKEDTEKYPPSFELLINDFIW